MMVLVMVVLVGEYRVHGEHRYYLFSIVTVREVCAETHNSVSSFGFTIVA